MRGAVMNVCMDGFLSKSPECASVSQLTTGRLRILSATSRVGDKQLLKHGTHIHLPEKPLGIDGTYCQEQIWILAISTRLLPRCVTVEGGCDNIIRGLFNFHLVVGMGAPGGGVSRESAKNRAQRSQNHRQ